MTWKDNIKKDIYGGGQYKGPIFGNRAKKTDEREFNMKNLITIAINQGLSNPKEILRIANFKRKEGDYLFTEEDLDEAIEIIKKEMDAYLYER